METRPGIYRGLLRSLLSFPSKVRVAQVYGFRVGHGEIKAGEST